MEIFLFGLFLAVVVGWYMLSRHEQADSNDVVSPISVEPKYTAKELQSMTKNQLLQLTENENIQVRSSWSKVRIIATILESN